MQLTFAGLMLRAVILTFLLFLFACPQPADAVLLPQQYGYNFSPDQVQLKKRVAADMDSAFRYPGKAVGGSITYQIESLRARPDRTIDFYIVLSLCLLLGCIRSFDPHYFTILLRSFRNPSGSRHFKEQIQGATVPNFLMNLFFAVILGAYLYFVGRNYAVHLAPAFGGLLMLMGFIGGVLAIYLGKYFVIRFSGWAFRVETITEQYLFNVFLINKIIGIILLPFVILIAFCDPKMISSLILISLMATGLLIFNRYTRSWAVFGSFFQYSRFHFFTYLCASEILPMAILLKLLLRTMA